MSLTHEQIMNPTIPLLRQAWLAYIGVFAGPSERYDAELAFDGLVLWKDSVDHEMGMLAARRRAAWELGDASWAAVIVNAYLHPVEDDAALRADRGRPGEITR